MPSKKKSKPSFHVPEELRTAPQTGWVYRSDAKAPAKEAKPAHKPPSGSKSTQNRKPAVAPAPIPVAAPKRSEAEPKHAAPAPNKKDRSSKKSSSGALDLTAKTLSAGFGTAGNILLLTTRIFTAPFMLGKRFLGL
jgi:hypothetical protein